MSFQSGFNSGLAITDSLRQSAAQRATLDQQSKRDAVTAKYQNVQADQIAAKMEREAALERRTTQDRVASQLVLGRIASILPTLDPTDPKDFREFSELMSGGYAKINSTKELERLTVIDKHFRDVMEHNGLNQVKNLKAQQHLQNLADAKELRDLGYDFEGSEENVNEKLHEYRNYKKIDEMLGNKTTAESVGIYHDEPFFTNEEFTAIKSRIREIGAENYKLGNLTADARQVIASRKKVAKAKTKGFMATIEASDEGKPLATSVSSELQESFTSLNLTLDAEVALKNLEMPTGKLFGPWIADVKQVFGQDQNINAFKAAITRLVPSLARGQYGEVGVLTDTDIERYMRTVASLDQSPNSNKKAMWATKVLLAKTLKIKTQREAIAGNSVSQFIPQLKRIADIPTTLYMSNEQAETSLMDDLLTGHVVPGDVIAVWDGKSEFVTDVARSIEDYEKD